MLDRCWWFCLKSCLLHSMSYSVGIKFLSGAPLFTKACHSRQLHMFDLTDCFLNKMSPSRIEPWLFCLLSKCVNHYTIGMTKLNFYSSKTVRFSTLYVKEMQCPCPSLYYEFTGHFMYTMNWLCSPSIFNDF